MVGAYGTALKPGVWSLLALVAALAWTFVRVTPGVSRASHVAVRMRDLVHSRLAVAVTVFFGLQALQAYAIVGWWAQYLRDTGLHSAAAAACSSA